MQLECASDRKRLNAVSVSQWLRMHLYHLYQVNSINQPTHLFLHIRHLGFISADVRPDLFPTTGRSITFLLQTVVLL